MSIENIKNRFFEIQGTTYSSVEEKRDALMTLDNITTMTIASIKPKILKGDAPRFLKWEYSDLLSFNYYINSELLNLGDAT